MSSTEVETIKNTLAAIRIPVTGQDEAEKAALKKEYKEKLNEVFQIVSPLISKAGPGEKKQYLSHLSDIMIKYGRVSYEENYTICMGMMLGALNSRLVALGEIDSLYFDLGSCRKLTDLQGLLLSLECISSFDEFLKGDAQAIASRIKDEGSFMPLGYAFLWFSNALLNSPGYKPGEVESNEARLGRVYDFCEEMLKKADTEDANIELAELYYNGRRGASLRKNPKDLEKSFKWLDKAKLFNPSLEMAARVENIKFCTHYDAGDLTKASEHLNEAIKIRESFSKEKQDPFLVAVLYNNLAALLNKNKKYDEAEAAVDKALKHSIACQEAGESHEYFGIFEAKKAQIKLAKGELDEAETYIQKAIKTYKSHPGSEESILAAEKLLKEIREKKA